MQEEKNNKYSTEYIRKYLDGQLSDQEMQSLEKAALEDPFLADAIDGIEESRNHAVSFESGIADLKGKLAERINRKNRKTGILFQLSKWQVAATLFILLGSAVFIVTFINKKIRTVDIALSPIKAAMDSSIPSIVKSEPENIGSDKNIPDNKIAVSPDKPAASQKPVAFRKEKNLVRGESDSSVFNQRSEPLKRDSYNRLKDSPGENAERDMVRRKDSILFAEPALKEPRPLLPEDLLSGKASGLEISRGKRDNGNYGYATTDEGSDYKEKKSGPEKTAGNKNVQPVTGWKTFYEYLNADKKIATADSLLRGEETVSFEVNANAELSSFKIIKSVSPAHDEEIIRLIKAGPAWKIKKGKKQICVVSMLFP